LWIGTVVVTQPAEANQIADRGRRNHYLRHHGTPSLAFAATTLSLGTR
jgi:hypothetical protein